MQCELNRNAESSLTMFLIRVITVILDCRLVMFGHLRSMAVRWLDPGSWVPLPVAGVDVDPLVDVEFHLVSAVIWASLRCFWTRFIRPVGDDLVKFCFSLTVWRKWA